MRAHAQLHMYANPFVLTYTHISTPLSCRRSLSKGLPRTFDVRKRQLEAGRRLVTTLTFFLVTLAAFLYVLVYLVATDDRESQEWQDETFWCAMNGMPPKLPRVARFSLSGYTCDPWIHGRMRVIFAFWIGSSGLWNFAVWVRQFAGSSPTKSCTSWSVRDTASSLRWVDQVTVVVPLARRNGVEIRPWW